MSISVETLALAKKYTDEHGGGTGGTSDYNLLSNLPLINGVQLKGNLTNEDLKINENTIVDLTEEFKDAESVEIGSGIYAKYIELSEEIFNKLKENNNLSIKINSSLYNKIYYSDNNLEYNCIDLLPTHPNYIGLSVLSIAREKYNPIIALLYTQDFFVLPKPTKEDAEKFVTVSEYGDVYKLIMPNYLKIVDLSEYFTTYPQGEGEIQISKEIYEECTNNDNGFIKIRDSIFQRAGDKDYYFYQTANGGYEFLGINFIKTSSNYKLSYKVETGIAIPGLSSDYCEIISSFNADFIPVFGKDTDKSSIQFLPIYGVMQNIKIDTGSTIQIENTDIVFAAMRICNFIEIDGKVFHRNKAITDTNLYTTNFIYEELEPIEGTDNFNYKVINANFSLLEGEVFLTFTEGNTMLYKNQENLDLPKYTSEDEEKILKIVGGKPTWVTL